MVLMRPMRAAIRAAASAEKPAEDVGPEEDGAERDRIGAEAQVEPIGDQALHDEAASECVEAEEG